MAFEKSTLPGAAGYEAAGLAWLADAGPDAASVVRVLGFTRDRIRLTRLSTVPVTVELAADFGRRLAITHDAGAAAFGAPPPDWSGDGWIGVEPMSLDPTPTWGRFYAEQRCLPYLHRAHKRRAISVSAATVIEQVCSRLADGRYDDAAPPARIHGDLWAGNVVPTAAGLTLIDPAAHGGHRLTDLAMLSLFGYARLDTILSAYAAESSHLCDGWRELLALHQLHPLLVHAAIFGGGYGAQAESIARRF